jgi:hypothetical protein
MKNTILRVLIGAMLFALIAGIVVTILGLMLGWKTSIQFSNGFFWAGALMIIVGFVSYQGYSQRFGDGPQVYLEPEERTQLWAADTFRGKNIMAMFGVSGLLLFGVSLLVGKLF